MEGVDVLVDSSDDERFDDVAPLTIEHEQENMDW